MSALSVFWGPSPPTPRRVFRGLVHEAARRTGGQVAGLTAADGVTPNFHQAVITYRDRTVAVLCSREDGSVAVAEPVDRRGCALVFLDEPGLVAVCRQFERFRMLSKDEAERPFDLADHPHMWTSDVKYWKPANTGEALFNWWDRPVVPV